MSNKLGDLVMIPTGPFGGSSGVIRSIDEGGAVIAAVAVFGREVFVAIQAGDLVPESQQRFARRHARRLICGRRGVLESYRASWHRRGYPEQRTWVQVTRHASKCRIDGTVLGSDSQGDWKPVKATERCLSEAEWHGVAELLTLCDFWHLPSMTGNVGLDGESWTLEGFRTGQYHSVERWSAGINETFGRACAHMAILARIWPFGG